MGLINYVILGFTHPTELRALIHYKLWHANKNIEDDPEAAGLDRESMRKCWEKLDSTSRSFSMVIKEVEGDLARTICLYYLVLRGLDTIEDDMTLDINLKVDLLLNFHKNMLEPGWTFSGSGENERDRHLLVDFDVVVTELGLLKKEYLDVIIRITRRMGFGMAHYCKEAHANDGVFSIETMQDFDLYCHFVAGVVGEGLSELAAVSDLESEIIGQQPTMSNSVGLMLQKTNILRDFRDDIDHGRMFWPKEIWGKYVDSPIDLIHPSKSEEAYAALSEMTFDALQHSIDVLNYLSMCKNQSYFNFVAIPQVMAVGTLELVHDNIDVFHRNVKLRRGQTASLILKATNARDAALVFYDCIKKIYHRATPNDPCYLKYSILLGQVEQWIETRYPSWVFAIAAPGGGAAQGIPTFCDDELAKNVRDPRVQQLPRTPETIKTRLEERKRLTTLDSSDKRLLAFIILAALFLFIGLALVSAMVVIWFSGGSIREIMGQVFIPFGDILYAQYLWVKYMVIGGVDDIAGHLARYSDSSVSSSQAFPSELKLDL